MARAPCTHYSEYAITRYFDAADRARARAIEEQARLGPDHPRVRTLFAEANCRFNSAARLENTLRRVHEGHWTIRLIAMIRGLDVPKIEQLVADRQRARTAGDFAKADELRQALRSLGVSLNDTPLGTAWRPLR